MGARLDLGRKTSPQIVSKMSKTVGDSRGLAPATEVARGRSFLKTLDAGSIPAASTIMGSKANPMNNL